MHKIKNPQTNEHVSSTVKSNPKVLNNNCYYFLFSLFINNDPADVMVHKIC